MIVPYLKKFGSLKVTCGLLVAFLLLLFWGVLGQSAAGNEGVSIATERFFGSFFLWAMGIVPLPAMKCLAVISSLHLICSLAFRMPRLGGNAGWKNIGLWGMHLALIVLLAGGVLGSEFKREYNGFRAVPGVGELQDVKTPQKITFFTVDDSLNTNAVEVGDGYPYFIFYKGQVDMFGVTVDMFTASYDPFKFVPYVFMVVFLLSAIFHYVVKVRGANKTRAGPNRMLLGPVVFLALLGMMGASNANASGVLEFPEDPVMVNGVLRPFDSFARGVLNDFCGRVTYKDGSQRYPANRILYLIQVDSAGKQGVLNDKLFKVLRSDVQRALNLPENERYVSYSSLNESRSQLELYASRKDDHPATAEMQRLLANIQLFESIQRGDFKKVEATSEQTKNFKVEVFYNRANFALISFILAFLSCVIAVVNFVFGKRFLDVLANLACCATAVVLAFIFVLRFYITGRPPLSGLYEIVLLVALLLESFEFGAFLFCKKRTFSLMIPVTMIAVILLFFAKFILEPGDLFQPIPAILNSSVFLTLHVFTIALGYVGIILSGIVAHVVLWRSKGADVIHDLPVKSTFSLLKGTLIFGSMFTIVGTLLGGVWADFAWGRFWGFDPKECGALFVILWSMLGLHLRIAHLITDRGFAIYNCFNMIVTFICWFGINLLGIGLHSYGFQNGTALWLGVFVIADAMVIALLSHCKSKSVLD